MNAAPTIRIYTTSPVYGRGKNNISPRPLAGEGLGEREFSAKETLSCRCATSSPVNGRGKNRERENPLLSLRDILSRERERKK